MKRLVLTLTCLWILLVLPVQAQEVPTLSTLEIALWPEFDRPEVLVIYRGQFEAGTPTPTPVEIRVPAGVGQPTAVAYIQDGQRLNQQYTTRLEGDWLVVSFDLATLEFQLEYYDTLPVDSTGQREYAFDYVADYPVASFNVEFQVPLMAEEFILTPAADTVSTESDGLVYHRSSATSLAQGEEQSWTFTYQKAGDELTISAFEQPGATTPTPIPSSGGGDSSTVLLFFVAFVALVAVGSVAFWLGRRTQPVDQAPASSSRQPKRRGSGRGEQPRTPGSRPSHLGTAFFCYQCGADLRPDSEFCHKCGAAVRGD